MIPILQKTRPEFLLNCCGNTDLTKVMSNVSHLSRIENYFATAIDSVYRLLHSLKGARKMAN